MSTERCTTCNAIINTDYDDEGEYIQNEYICGLCREEKIYAGLSNLEAFTVAAASVAPLLQVQSGTGRTDVVDLGTRRACDCSGPDRGRVEHAVSNVAYITGKPEVEAMQQKARALAHYSEQAWEAEHLDLILAEESRLLTPDTIAEAVAEMPDAAMRTVAQMVRENDAAALGSLMLGVISAYVYQDAVDAVKFRLDDPHNERYCDDCNREISPQDECGC